MDDDDDTGRDPVTNGERRPVGAAADASEGAGSGGRALLCWIDPATRGDTRPC